MTPKRNVSTPDTRERMLRLAKKLYAGEIITARAIVDEFGLSWSSAKRDIQLIRMFLPVTHWRPRYKAEIRVAIPRVYRP